MKRHLTFAVAAVFMAAASAVSGAAAHDQCVSAPDWKYCGEHPADLPMSFRLNMHTRPAGIGMGVFDRAATGAAETWNLAWPGGKTGTRCMPLCIAAERTDKTVAAPDGVNAIFWSAGTGCAPSGSDPVAVACVWFAGSSGTARHRIIDVDIVLNANKPWKQFGTELLEGDVVWAFPGPGAGFDLQSVLTHELGHALGLEDLGTTDPNRRFPASLAESVPYQQTMYRWYYPGSTNKRTLAEGDIAGLTYIAATTGT
jgi:hypothetical protein